MDDFPEIKLKLLCCTCLSSDRNLKQLCKVVDGVNMLYFLLSFDAEAYREGFFKDTAHLYICWECRASLRRLTRLRRQACIAQRWLADISDGKLDIQSLSTLSQLTYHHKTSYDMTVISSDPTSDNFVDCGPVDIKSEDDEVPLSELINSQEETNDIIHNHFDIIEENSDQLHIKVVENGVNKNLRRKKYEENHINDELKRTKPRRRKIKKLSYKSTKKKRNIENCKNDMDSKTKNKIRNNVEIENNIDKYDETTLCEKEMAASTFDMKCHRLDERTAYGYSCAECNKYFTNKNQRWKHVQMYHREGYECDTCGKRFPFKSNLSRHFLVHQGPLPRQQCPTCLKMVRTDLYKVHVRIHTQRDNYSCAACSKSFVSRASYEYHLKYTQAHAAVDVLKHKCTMCDKGYRSRGELRDHVNFQHLGKTKHKCPVCGKALATPRCITRHVRRAHHGLKETARDKICQQCGKAFRDKKALREHEFIHTGERPLSCEVCGCTFRQTASLYTHRKRVHKIYPQKKHVQLDETQTDK